MKLFSNLDLADVYILYNAKIVFLDHSPPSVTLYDISLSHRSAI